MPVTSFDWASLGTAYGEAGVVPGLLAQAVAADDPFDALDTVAEAVVFVCDAGSLNDGAPALAEQLLEIARRPERAGAPGWPFLRGVLQIASARAALAEHFGLAPVNRAFPGADLRTLGERLVTQERQTELHREVDRRIAAEEDLLCDRLARGLAEDRAAAIVLCVLAGRRGARVAGAARAGLSAEERDPTRAALLLGLTRVGSPGDEPALRDLIVHEQAAQGVRGLGAVAAALWRRNQLPRATQEAILERLPGALTHVDPRPVTVRFDYGWHDEMMCGETARALHASSLEPGLKQTLLRRAVGSAPRVEHGELLPATNAAVPAAWFLMRLSLDRYHQRPTIVGPEELSPDESEAIRFLAGQETWLQEGGYLPAQFGMPAFVEAAPRLGDVERDDPLALVVSGVWEQRWVAWSRWKWLRAALDHTHYASDARRAALTIASHAVLDGLDTASAIDVALAAAAEPGLPFEALLMRLIERAAAGEPAPIGVAELSALVEASRPDDGDARRRTQIARIVLEALFSDTPESLDSVMKALSRLRAPEILRERLEGWSSRIGRTG